MTSQSTETIYRCALNKETPYSVYFGEQSRDLGYRIQQVERVLENLEPFYKKVQITIMDDRPLLYRVQGHQIFIGRQLLEAPGHLEKGLAKIWYRERNQTLFAQQNLLEEVMSDFLVYLANGDLDIGDPNTHIATALRRIKWPYIIKSVTSYCESPWKQSEHFGVCQNVKESEEELASQVTEMSLRPLLVSNWIFSYLELSMKERYEFTKNLPSFIRSDHTSSLPVTSEIPVGLTNTTLVRSIEAVRNVSLFISSSNVRSESGAHRNFLINLANELRLSGFQDAFAQVSFDVVFVSTDPVTESSKIFQDFQKIAEDHPKMQLALRDQKNLWLLPSRFPIPLSSFGQIKAHRTIVEKCGGYNFSYIMDYSDFTEKLLVVDHCDAKREIHYESLIASGVESFGVQNKGVAFVQFHLPSLLMKKEDLQRAGNVFEFIKKRDVENPSFKSLGWREVLWNQQANAYQPKAFVDAIEWFRIPGVDKL